MSHTKRNYLFWGLVLLLILLITYFLEQPNNNTRINGNQSNINVSQNLNINPTCSDGTNYSACSKKQPLFCNKGELINKSSICGCKGLIPLNEGCIPKYAKPINHELIFVRNLSLTNEGRREKINFTTYGSINDYLESSPRFSYNNSSYNNQEFVLNNIDNNLQDEFLQKLVEKIKMLSPDKDEQARIAISIGQMIPYNSTEKYLRAYEILHKNMGACAEKSELIVYLLRELGYGTALFLFDEEHHATAAIKCPVDYSYRKSGYCFVEATSLSLIGESNNYYVDVGRLSYNPRIMVISEGIEYKDIIRQVESAKEELNYGMRFKVTDRNGAVILRWSDLESLNTHPDIIIEYPQYRISDSTESKRIIDIEYELNKQKQAMIESATKELNEGKRFKVTDRNGAVILRWSDLDTWYEHPDVIIEYPQ